MIKNHEKEIILNKDKKYIINLCYDPYKFKLAIVDENNNYDHNNGLCNKPFNEQLNHAIKYFENMIQGKDEILCIFEGRSYEFNITKSKIESEYETSHKKISFEHICKYEYNIKKIEQQIKQLPKDFFINDSKKEVILEQLNSNTQMYIIGLYSAGKSTFINAMIGDNLLYSHSDIATNKLYRIIDNDKDIIEIKTFNKEKQISKKSYKDITLAASALEIHNEEENIDTVYVEVNVPNIDSNNYKLELIDTPGVNNAHNKSHQTIVYDAINDTIDFPPIILIIDAWNSMSNDSSDLFDNLLQTIEKVQSKDNFINLERFFFIINRADTIPFKEYESTYEKIKNMIENKLGTGAKIYSTNSQCALLIRKQLKSIELEIEDEDKLETYIRRVQKGSIIQYLPKYSTILTSIHAPVIDDNDTEEIKLKKALEYTAIPIVEKAIQEYLENYSIIHKLEYTFNKLNEIKVFNESRLDEFNLDIPEIESTIFNLEFGKKTISEQISSIEVEIEKLKKQKDTNEKAKKSLKEFVENMKPSIDKYIKDINDLNLDDSNLNKLQNDWSIYISNLTKDEKNATYRNKDDIKKRIDQITTMVTNKKKQIHSEANANMGKKLRNEAKKIVTSFHGVINENIHYLGKEGKKFKEEIEVSFDDDKTPMKSHIEGATRNLSAFDILTFGIPRFFQDTLIIDLNSLKKEDKKFKDTLTEIKNRSTQQLIDLKDKNHLNLIKFAEIIKNKELELEFLKQNLKESADNLERAKKSLKEGKKGSYSLQNEHKKLEKQLQTLKNKIEINRNKINIINNILNQKSENEK
jgi:hypothetical protein